ncbi:MAG: hypothetical protein IJV39_02040 [Ruminococcus sp.]|nr:hypothetical protein [Ruminococcus sp.]
MRILKHLSIIAATLMLTAVLPLGTVYAEPDDTDNVPDETEAYTEAVEPQTEYIPEEPQTEATQPEITEPETVEPETEYIPPTEAPTQAPETEYTEPETDEPETVFTEPLTEGNNYIDYVEEQPTTRDLSQLPTLMDSTEIAEKLPVAVGADSENGGVSYIGGIICWICVGVAVSVILAFVLSTTGKGRSGIGRYDSGDKLGGTRYR